MHEAEVPAARIYTIEDIFNDPHYAARGMLARVPDEDFGTVTMPAVVPKLKGTPGVIRHAGRRIGQDTRGVLREVAGYSDAEIQQLEAAKIIACDPGGERNPSASKQETA